MSKTKKRKQTLESAQYGLEINLKQKLAEVQAWVGLLESWLTVTQD